MTATGMTSSNGDAEYQGQELETMTITNRHDKTTRLHWSEGGRYSLSTTHLTKDGIFTVNLRAETQVV